MPDSLLTVLRLLLLTLIWMFFVRVLFLLAAKPRPLAASAPAMASATPAAAAPPVAGRSQQSGKAHLRVTSGGEHAGKEFTVGTEATIGRGQGCQVQLADSMVSQLHARLFRDGNGLHLEDLGSTNGTYLNGRKVGGPAKLKKGDKVRVGPVELEVVS